VTPYEIGYGPFVKFDYEFIGSEALEKIKDKPHRRKVTFAWNGEDVTKVFASMFTGGGESYKYIDLPLSNYASASFLVDHKADVNKADAQRFTPLFWSVDRRNMETAPNFPWMVTADEVANPDDMVITLHCNDDLRQTADTKDLIYDCGRLIEFASSFYTLYPGDVIFTGTPEGVSPIEAGDEIVATIEKIGTMRVRVRAAEAAPVAEAGVAVSRMS